MRTSKIQQHLTAILVLTSSLILTACGGGGGSGVTPAGTTPLPVAQAAQTRALKGFTVTVVPNVLPGAANNQPTTVDISVDNPAVLATNDSAQFWNGDDYENTANNVVVTASSQPAPGKWQLTWPKQTKTESGLLIRFKLSNGDVIETAVNDFRFK
jgi:hypothetical protein